MLLHEIQRYLDCDRGACRFYHPGDYSKWCRVCLLDLLENGPPGMAGEIEFLEDDNVRMSEEISRLETEIVGGTSLNKELSLTITKIDALINKGE